MFYFPKSRSQAWILKYRNLSKGWDKVEGGAEGGRGGKPPIIIPPFFCSLAFEHTAAKWGLGIWGPSRGEISRLLGYHLRWSLDNAWSKCCLQVARLWYSGNGNHECVLRKRHGKGNVILCALLYFICYYVMVIVCYFSLSVASIFYGWIVLSTVVKDKGIVLYPLDRAFSSGALRRSDTKSGLHNLASACSRPEVS